MRAAALNPLRYVMPGPPDDATHVAYFTAPVAPAGTCHLIQANATFGWSGGKPFIHCHAAWTEPDGRTRGGHILPLEAIVAEPAEATAWGFRDLRIEAAPDPETNFTLFQPNGVSGEGNALLARVKPNQDILAAIEAIAPPEATVRGSLGSLIGASFTDGRVLDDIATEVLVRQGFVRGGRAELELLVVDMHGYVHQGWLERDANAVCITFDLVIT
jgi:predicted DNA-binding protein with PD1-like motif